MYLWNPRAFVSSQSNFFQSVHPVRIKILTQEFHVICGPKNIKPLLKSSWACTSITFVKFALGYAFGLPAKALSLYDKDDSGGGPVPHSGSSVEARKRVDYQVHQSLIIFLEGKGLLPFWSRFTDNITEELYTLHDRLDPDGNHFGDLMRVVGDETAVSIINALCGPYLLSLNPGSLQDYWDFDRNLQTYLQGIPWSLAPRALRAVEVWQQHARDHFNDSAVGTDGDDPYWGSSFFRERQKMFLEMDGFDYAAIASEEFGEIWA